jgi:hypothetical protein
MSKLKEVIYEDEYSVSIWKYNPYKPNSGPVEVEHKWKKNFNPWEKVKKKTLGDLVKEQKTKRSVKN